MTRYVEGKRYCDCCNELRECSHLYAYGIETWACAECQGIAEEDIEEHRAANGQFGVGA
jgi:hypothetical protein